MALLIFSLPFITHAVEVVPIGQTIKPEGAEEGSGGGSRPARKRPSVSTIAAGKSFSIESAQILSSALNQEGETVYFRASEDVGSTSRPVIHKGAIAKGILVGVDKNKKNGKLMVRLDSIEAVDGDSIKIKGDLKIEEQGAPAVLTVGKIFSATLDEKAIVKGKHKKEAFPNFDKNIPANIQTSGLKVSLAKGSIKGKVEIILEGGQGIKAEDINPDSVVIYRINNQWLPEEILAIGGKSKVGDRNKDGNNDLGLQFDTLNFIKYQASGNNTLYLKAKLSNGSEIGASGRTSIEY